MLELLVHKIVTMACGCTNPAAANFDPAATEEDYTCIYLEKVDGICYYFTDVDPNTVTNHGFTMSYSVLGNNWVFFHDYLPDFYFHTREKLHLISAKNIFTANTGIPGMFLPVNAEDSLPNGKFFVDVVFNSKEEVTLDTLNWITEVFDRGDTPKSPLEFQTLSHITIWNTYQVTGRIPISAIEQQYQINNIRKTQSTWKFNEFRDMLIGRGATNFLLDIFNNFAIDTTYIDTNLPWYERKLLEDHYFVVRFEFSNGVGEVPEIQVNYNKDVLLHEVSAEATPSAR
jgi:hypothetical protein